MKKKCKDWVRQTKRRPTQYGLSKYKASLGWLVVDRGCSCVIDAIEGASVYTSKFRPVEDYKNVSLQPFLITITYCVDHTSLQI